MLNMLEQLFLQADGDGSGGLDRTELATVVHRFYREEKCSRSFRSVQEECDSALRKFDSDGNQVLDFGEFIELVCTDTGFKLRMDASTKAQLMELVRSSLPARMADPESAAARRARWEKENKLLTCEVLEVQNNTAGDADGAPVEGDQEASALLAQLREIFTKADDNGNGALDMNELTRLLHSQYRTERVARSLKQVGREVQVAMLRYDTDGSGTLNFHEYTAMFCEASELKFKIRREMKARVLILAQRDLQRQREEEEQIRLEAEAVAVAQRREASVETLQGWFRGRATRAIEGPRRERCGRVLNRLVDLFENADGDRSGSLSTGELAQVHLPSIYQLLPYMDRIPKIEQP